MNNVKILPVVRIERLENDEPDEPELDYCAVCDGHGFYDDPRTPCEHCSGSGIKRY
jgi:hypothetical protein